MLLRRRGGAIFLAAAAFFKITQGFYVPLLAPQSYAQFEEIPLKVVSLTSTRTQLPYDYYHAPYCKPKSTKHQSENLGEVLTGDSIQSSPYVVNARVDVVCQKLCRLELTDAEMAMFAELIDGDYRVHMMLDSLPVAVRNSQLNYARRGWPVGFVIEENEENPKRQHFINNHIRITVRYNENASFTGIRIVGFDVTPFSIKHDYTLPAGKAFDDSILLKTCNVFQSASNSPSHRLSADKGGEVIFTYDVQWEQSDVEWSHRWDVYMNANPEDEIHFFSIVNSLMITLFLTMVVAMIMLRTLKRDITSYNEVQSLEASQEESGWKLVHGDVFKPPSTYPMLLAVLAGTGLQVFLMTLTTIGFAFMGFLSPANRGGMLTTVLVVFVLCGSAAGYWSSRLYKQFGGKNWKRNTSMTAVLFPAIVFTIFWILNICVWFEGSSTAVPVGIFVSLLLMWFGISAPLVLLGSYYGLKAEPFNLPVRTNQIARIIPDQHWYTRQTFATLIGGILPFGAVCIELFFIMSALWLHQIYYVFGFLSVVFLILVATCAEISIVLCYFQLCCEDYRWWWRSFCGCGSSALYLFLYSIWYYIFKLDIEGAVPSAIYFGYMIVISLTFALLTGSIGLFSCFWFVRKIYGAIKVD